jgi:hypothetical protein
MTSAQIQLAYRLAVQRCLVVFYFKGEMESERLVDAWWKRLAGGRGLRSGMYLHSEALTTATDLARAEEVAVTDTVRRSYQEILRESTRLALSADPVPNKAGTPERLKQMV